MASVRFENISFSFGDNNVLQNFSLKIEESQIMCLVGPSGCGKTTLVRCLLGLNKPSQGEIYVGDTCVFSSLKRINIPAERRGIGIVFQDYAVWPHMTVRENIAYPMRKRRMAKAEIEKRVVHALEQVHMSEYINHLPGQLSGGQQQRVAIARALVSSDQLIVMDEPITNLDAKLREQMLLEIREIQRNIGTTILYVTHDQRSALHLCDKIAVMQPDGSLSQIGSDEDIILRPSNRFTFEFIGVTNFIPIRFEGKYCSLDMGGELFPWEEKLPTDIDFTKHIELGVRPNDIVFDNNSPIRATVRRTVFLGSEYDYFIESGNKELRVQQSSIDAALTGAAREGSEVGITFINPHYYEALMK